MAGSKRNAAVAEKGTYRMSIYIKVNGTEYPAVLNGKARDGEWDRSPDGSDSTIFCDVNSGGGADRYNAKAAFGAAFGFCF